MATKTADAAKEDTDAKGGGKKKLIIIVVAVLVLGGGAFFFLKPKGDAEPKPPEPGPVVVLEPITINLAKAHYLKLGLALQPIAAGSDGEVDGSKALDLAIDVFSGKSIDELAKPEGRKKAKEKLLEEVKHAYHEEVYDIYFTEFVMQ